MENHATKRIMHVTRPGHRCYNPLRRYGIVAEQVQMGEFKRMGGWELWASLHAGRYVYVVNHIGLTGDYYEFSNFDCAAAKLAELGGAVA